MDKSCVKLPSKSEENENYESCGNDQVETSINKLPTELQVEIFEYLTFSEKLVCTLVCKSWLELFENPTINKNVWFKFREEDIAKNTEPFELIMKSNRVFYRVMLIRSKFPRKISDVDLCCAKLGETCHVLKISNCTSPSGRLSDFVLLNELCINSLDTLKQYPVSSFPSTLKILTLNAVHERENPDVIEILDSIKSLEVVTATKFFESKIKSNSQLFELSTEVKNIFAFGKIFLKNINLLKIKKLELHHVTMDYNFSIDTWLVVFGLNLSDTITEIRVKQLTARDSCWFTHDTIDFRKVEKCNLILRSECRECIKCFFESCLNIQQLKVKADASTLQHIFECPTPHQFTELVIETRNLLLVRSSKIFATCAAKFQQLKFLHLKYIALENVTWKQWPEMPNLQYLKLTNCCTPTTGMKLIIPKTPQVVKFAYSDIFKEDYALEGVEKWKHLKFFAINDQIVVGNLIGKLFISANYESF